MGGIQQFNSNNVPLFIIIKNNTGFFLITFGNFGIRKFQNNLLNVSKFIVNFWNNFLLSQKAGGAELVAMCVVSRN